MYEKHFDFSWWPVAQGVPTAQKLVSRVFSDPVLLSKLAGHINQCKLMPSLARSSQNEFSSLEQVLRRNLETVERIQAEALQRQAAQKKLEQEQAAAERRELEKAAAEAAALEAVRRKQEEDAAAAERKRLDDEAAEQRREEKELEERRRSELGWTWSSTRSSMCVMVRRFLQ